MAISRAAKAYRELIETLAQVRMGYKVKDSTKELKDVKKTMRAFKPEAYDELYGLRADSTLEYRSPEPSMGETTGSFIKLNPSRSRNYGLDQDTFAHEMGHHLMYRDKTHPLSKYHRSAKQIHSLPEKEQKHLRGEMESQADEFLWMTNQRMKGRPKDPDHPMSKWLKSLAVGGSTMGILDLLGPSEAEAMPRGVYQGITKAALSGEVSSAAKVLVGKVLDGKTIKDVRKGTGNWRGILFDDDTMMTVTNTELNDLSRAFGTQKYTGAFQGAAEGATKTEQALKSLDYHYSRVKPFVTKGTTELYHKRHVERLKEMGLSETPSGSLVSYKGKFFTMPTEYARHLQDLGLVKVEKEIK